MKPNRKTNMDDWARQEFPDSEKIIKMDKGELYFEIWKSRSRKTTIFLIGLLIGIASPFLIKFIKSLIL